MSLNNPTLEESAQSYTFHVTCKGLDADHEEVLDEAVKVKVEIRKG